MKYPILFQQMGVVLGILVGRSRRRLVELSGCLALVQEMPELRKSDVTGGRVRLGRSLVDGFQEVVSTHFLQGKHLINLEFMLCGR